MMTGKNDAGGSSHFRAFNSDGEVWSTDASAYVTWVDVDWENYQIAATSTGGGWYQAEAPADAVRADLCITGASLILSPSVWVWEAPATGGGDVGTGDGDIAVNHNYGGADELQILDGDDDPVDNAKIDAYLASDTGLSQVIARTYSGSDGRWVAPLMLDPDEYLLVISKPGQFQSDQVALTVEES